MKDSEFIELLNLYLDHEISAADATRLEAEVLGNPARRDVYQQYCRMQKGCKLLAEDFASSPAPLTGNVVEFPRQAAPRRHTLVVAGALTAAAASLAFILTGRSPLSPAPVPSIVAAPAMSAPAVAVVPSSEAASVQRSISRGAVTSADSPLSGAGSLSLGRASPAGSPALRFAGDASAKQFEWMKTLQLPPVQRVPAEQLRFEAKSPLQADSRTYHSGQPPQDAVEMTAFRFQR
jgi:hypothetical protein